MTPNTDQSNAMAQIRDFMGTPVSNELTTRLLTLTGPAGSGKTTLLRMIQDEIDGAIICAPTNKAVAQIRRNGFKRATTLDKVVHKKMYTPHLRPPTEVEIEFHNANDLEVPEWIEEPYYETIDN